MPRAAQRGDRGIAAHEADQQPLDRSAPGRAARATIWSMPGRDEAGAARHHQMGDRRRAATCARKRVDRGERQRGRRLGIERHPRGGAGMRLGGVEAARIDRRAAAAVDGSTDQRCPIPARAAIRSNSLRSRSGSRARAQAMKAAWMSWSGTAVPIALRWAVMSMM